MKQLLTILIMMSLSFQINAQCLVADYRFSGNANDSSGNGNNGTVTGATLTNDRYGNLNAAYDFNAVGSGIEFMDITYLLKSDRSISFWFKTQFNGEWQRILNHRPTCVGGAEEGFSILIKPMTNEIRYEHLGSGINDVPFTPNTWNKMDIVTENDTAYFYINGQFVDKSGYLKPITQSTILGASSACSCIANFGNDNNRYIGQLDDVKILNCALTITQIDSIYAEEITMVGIIKNKLDSELIVYPNPTYGNFSIDLGANNKSVQIKITDLNGRLIKVKEFSNSKTLNLSLEEPAGIYFLTITSEDKTAIVRILKE